MLNTKDVEQTGGYYTRGHSLRLLIQDQVGVSNVVCLDLFKSLRLLAPVNKIYATHIIKVRHYCPIEDDHDPVRVSVRWRLKQYRIHHAEDCAVCANG